MSKLDLFTSKSIEWYTPPHIIQLAIDILDGIDLDPAAEAARSVPARAHYTEIENGLLLPWYIDFNQDKNKSIPAKVYLNPPYGRTIRQWTKKLNAEFECGNVSEAVVLLPARVDTLWWGDVAGYPVCFLKGRLKFSGHQDSAKFPSALVYLGPNKYDFLEKVEPLGRLYLPVNKRYFSFISPKSFLRNS